MMLLPTIMVEDYTTAYMSKMTQVSTIHPDRNIRKDCRTQLVAEAETLETFADDVGLLWSPQLSLPILDDPPTSLEFSRSFVSRR